MGQVAAHPAASYRQPEPLLSSHNLSGFKSREAALDEWLTKRAFRNEAGRTSRTFVVCAPGCSDVIGFYSLATGAVQRDQAPKGLQRNAPDPIPVMVLGRLAVAEAWERKGIGSGLLSDAIRRTYSAGEIAGIAALLVHSKSEQARVFYHRSGFKPSLLNPLTLVLSLRELEHELNR